MKRLILAAAMAAVAIGPAAAQADYPARPVRIIVPLAPGGPVDVIARAIASTLQERLKQPFVIENRPGAGGNIGIRAAVASEPDGYTLVMSTGSMLTINPLLSEKPPFDPLADLRAISMVTRSSQTLVVHPSLPVSSVKDFIAYAKQRPLTYATSGYGSPSHLTMEYLRLLAGFQATPVSYRGLTPLMVDLLAGEVKVGFVATSGAIDQAKQGKLRTIAVSSARRSAMMPDVPTIAESGYPDFDVDSYIVLAAPTRTPEPILALLESEVRRAALLPSFQEKFQPRDLVGIGTSAAETGAWIERELQSWEKIVKAANMRSK